jgi:hypothetical protein
LNRETKSFTIIYKNQTILINKDKLFINIFVPEVWRKAIMKVLASNQTKKQCILLLPAQIKLVMDSNTIRIKVKDFELLVEVRKFKRKYMRRKSLDTMKSRSELNLGFRIRWYS